MIKVSKRYVRRLLPVVLAFALVGALAPTSAFAAPNTISLQASDPTISSATNTFTWTWSGYQTATAVKCVQAVWSVNADGSGGKPAGMTVSGTTFGGTMLTGQTFTANDTNAATGTVVYGNGTGVTPAAGPKTMTIGTVTNPSAAGTNYLTITTYSGNVVANACSGSVLDAGTAVAFATTANTVVSVTVNPTFTFAVNSQAGGTACNGVAVSTVASTSTAVAFGGLAAGARAYGTQQLQVTTNAGGGYVVYLHSTAASANVLKGSGAHVFADAVGTAAVPGAGNEFFGYTTDSTTAALGAGNIKAVPTNAGNNVVGNGVAGTNVNNCVEYAVGASATTAADSYSSTIVYTAVPTF